MKLSAESTSLRKSAVWGGVLCMLLGLVLLRAPVANQWFNALSLDLLDLALPWSPQDDVVIVAMDEESYGRLGQSPERLWDRRLHQKLLDIAMANKARAVVFDVLFAENWPDPQVDEAFANALSKAKGKVVLAGSLRPFEGTGAGGAQTLQPIERFGSVAPWGIVEMPKDPDGVLRRQGVFPYHTSLAWKAAETLGASASNSERARWLRYYGSKAIRHIPYWQVLENGNAASTLLSNKVVFVGKAPVITTRGGNTGDEYPTPATRWTGNLMSGVEIEATAFLNLLRRDWIEESPSWAEVILFILTGGVFGFGLTLARPRTAVVLAIAGVLLVTVGSIALFRTQRLWFPWLIVAGVQVPLAVGWSVLSFVVRASQAKDIPDHTLLRCVGRGGYGEVWLARDAIGGFHAVKMVYRKNFPSPEPFEREFQGIKTFAPLSRSHPGLVHILHVGRNDLRGCFYCVMEAADDEVAGPNIQPDRYVPRTLARELGRRGRLPANECIQLGLALASALDHLHQRQIIHRDIKPANIIYVTGHPKLADVGLVKALNAGTSEVTRVGSSGYMPPEGRGSAQADVYALGKTLYEAATGFECGQFPELPADLNAGSEADALIRLHEILLTACETDLADRYGSAATMHAALLELQRSLAALSTRTV